VIGTCDNNGALCDFANPAFGLVNAVLGGAILKIEPAIDPSNVIQNVQDSANVLPPIGSFALDINPLASGRTTMTVQLSGYSAILLDGRQLFPATATAAANIAQGKISKNFNTLLADNFAVSSVAGEWNSAIQDFVAAGVTIAPVVPTLRGGLVWAGPQSGALIPWRVSLDNANQVLFSGTTAAGIAFGAATPDFTTCPARTALCEIILARDGVSSGSALVLNIGDAPPKELTVVCVGPDPAACLVPSVKATTASVAQLCVPAAQGLVLAQPKDLVPGQVLCLLPNSTQTVQEGQYTAFGDEFKRNGGTSAQFAQFMSTAGYFVGTKADGCLLCVATVTQGGYTSCLVCAVAAAGATRAGLGEQQAVCPPGPSQASCINNFACSQVNGFVPTTCYNGGIATACGACNSGIAPGTPAFLTNETAPGDAPRNSSRKGLLGLLGLLLIIPLVLAVALCLLLLVWKKKRSTKALPSTMLGTEIGNGMLNDSPMVVVVGNGGVGGITQPGFPTVSPTEWGPYAMA